MPEEIMKLYIALSPLVIMLSARAIAVAKYCKRTPSAHDIWRFPSGIPSQDLAWFGALKVFSYIWAGIFLFAYFRGIALSHDPQKIMKGFFAITAFNIACVWNSLHSIKHYSSEPSEFSTKTDENKEFLKKIDIFPGFGGRLNTAISTGTVLLSIFIGLAIIL